MDILIPLLESTNIILETLEQQVYRVALAGSVSTDTLGVNATFVPAVGIRALLWRKDYESTTCSIELLAEYCVEKWKDTALTNNGVTLFNLVYIPNFPSFPSLSFPCLS